MGICSYPQVIARLEGLSAAAVYQKEYYYNEKYAVVDNSMGFAIIILMFVLTELTNY